MLERLRGSRPLQAILAVGLVAVVAWLGAVSAALLRAYSHAGDATGTLESVSGVTPGQFVTGEGIDTLREARGEFALAHRATSAWYVAPARFVPGIGRQVRSADSLTGAAVSVLDTGIDAVSQAKTRIEEARGGGMARVRALEGVARIASDAETRLDRLDLGPSSLLVAPLHRARAKVAEQLGELDDSIARLQDASSGMASFLKGPRTYLLLAANNNEMRIGSGTFLTAGRLTVRDGEIDLGDTVSTANLRIDPSRSPALPADMERLWGWLRPTSEWRNLAASPRFDVNGRFAAEMSKAALGADVDGVLAVDPVALRSIVAAVGSVQYRGRELSADEVLPELLLGQYEGIQGYDDPQIDRREDLGDMARAALDALDAGRWRTDVLLDELGDAASGRHVLAWSRRPREQSAWKAAGIDGSLDADSLMVGVHNRGGNKLDTFLQVYSDVVTKRDTDGTNVQVVVTLRNVAPAGLPQYVEGPYPGARGGGAGVYQGIAVVQMPEVATDLVATGGSKLVGYGDDGPSRVAAVQVKMARGESQQVIVGFRLPKGVRELTVEPSGRADPVLWRNAGLRWRDEGSRVIEW